MRAIRFHLACTALLALIYGFPAVVAVALFGLAPAGFWKLAAAMAGPVLYVCLFAFTAGLLSRPFQSAIVPGKFPRDLGHPTYRKRRYYGLCWTALYYCKPVYYLCLTLPWLKGSIFRLFGYRGQMDFTLYPDTWIRDLPLLEIGKGAYIANRATLGTNMPLRNGKILVDRIRIGDGALIGHLTMLAVGVEIGDQTEIESGCALGLRVKVGSRCVLAGTVSLSHYSQIGNHVSIGAGSCVGYRSRVPDGARLGSLTGVPDRSTWNGSVVPAELEKGEPVEH